MADQLKTARMGADTYRAAAEEAYRRAGVALCDDDGLKAALWAQRAEVFKRNAYVVEGGK